MKATVTNTEPEFQPVELKISLQSQNELDVIASLFNARSIADVLERLGIPSQTVIKEIIAPLRAMGADATKHTSKF